MERGQHELWSRAMADGLSIAWCDTPLRAAELADFFAANVGMAPTEYRRAAKVLRP